MNRHFVKSCLLALGIFLAVSGCASANRQPPRLLFVVPTQFPDGAPTGRELGTMEEWMATRAGGFTRINGVEGGWIAPNGDLIRESNVLYLLTLPPGGLDGFRSELEDKILEDFQQQEAWIQEW